MPDKVADAPPGVRAGRAVLEDRRDDDLRIVERSERRKDRVIALRHGDLCRSGLAAYRDREALEYLFDGAVFDHAFHSAENDLPDAFLDFASAERFGLFFKDDRARAVLRHAREQVSRVPRAVVDDRADIRRYLKRREQIVRLADRRLERIAARPCAQIVLLDVFGPREDTGLLVQFDARRQSEPETLRIVVHFLDRHSSADLEEEVVARFLDRVGNVHPPVRQMIVKIDPASDLESVEFVNAFVFYQRVLVDHARIERAYRHSDLERGTRLKRALESAVEHRGIFVFKQTRKVLAERRKVVRRTGRKGEHLARLDVERGQGA